MKQENKVLALLEQVKKKKMAKASEKHIHRYERRDIGTRKHYIVYHCALPNCSTYFTPELVIGKLSICPHCEVAFQLQRHHLELVKPHCDECKDPRNWRNRTQDSSKVTSRRVVSEAFADLIIKASRVK